MTTWSNQFQAWAVLGRVSLIWGAAYLAGRFSRSATTIPGPAPSPLTRTDTKSFVAAISAVLKPSTVATVYVVLRSLMQSAVDDGVVPAHPCSRVPLPRVEPRVMEPPAAAQVIALAEAITPRYRPAV